MSSTCRAFQDIEQAKAHIPPVKKPYLPPPRPNESKVETLKKKLPLLH
jgi:hypothetical protein